MTQAQYEKIVKDIRNRWFTHKERGKTGMIVPEFIDDEIVVKVVHTIDQNGQDDVEVYAFLDEDRTSKMYHGPYLEWEDLRAVCKERLELWACKQVLDT